MALIALLGFLFGYDIVGRLNQPEITDDVSDDVASRQPQNEEWRFHASYSFAKTPFVHPRIVGDLVGMLSDSGDQVAAINLTDSQDSNRYFGEFFVAPQTDPMVPSWPWVTTLDIEQIQDGKQADSPSREFHAYQYLGSTQDGLDVLHVRYSGGGSGVFNSLIFVRIEADYSADYPLLRDIDGGREPAEPETRQRELIRIMGRISLGDRWHGTVEVVGNDVVVRGRDLYERCQFGSVSTMEEVEMEYFMDIDCKDGESDHPPPARVYSAPGQAQ